MRRYRDDSGTWVLCFEHAREFEPNGGWLNTEPVPVGTIESCEACEEIESFSESFSDWGNEDFYADL